MEHEHVDRLYGAARGIRHARAVLQRMIDGDRPAIDEFQSASNALSKALDAVIIVRGNEGRDR